MKKLLISAIFVSLISTSTAFAHDAKFHKGPMIEGEIISLQKDHLDVKTAKGTVAVLLSADTKFEVGKEGNAASQSDLKQGQTVMVSGHKLETGEMAATEVMIHNEGTESTTHNHSK